MIGLTHIFEHLRRIMRSAMLDSVQCAAPEHELGVGIVCWHTDMVPVRVAQDDIVDVIRWIQASLLETGFGVRKIDNGLPLGKMVLHASSILTHVSFNAQVEHNTLWSIAIGSRMLDQEAH